LREDIGRGAPQFQCSLSGDRFDVGNAADAVGSKNFPLFSHGLIETLES
jgi:hypothetical protein